MGYIPMSKSSFPAPLPQNLQPLPVQVRKRKSTIGENDTSSRKNTKMSTGGRGLLDNPEVDEAGSDDACKGVIQQFQKMMLARREKAERLVGEMKWIVRSCGFCDNPLTWQGICKTCGGEDKRDSERKLEPLCVSCSSTQTAPGQKCKSCLDNLCKKGFWTV